LGLGLAKIREGAVDEGTKEIETAASLDPNNSLIRSYLGKAYYEQNRDGLAETEYEQAKLLDPKDPTPWFYDAIHKQTTNRPVEALHDLQKSIELNDNRAVYRSKLLLDRDLATRNTSLGRIYSDLGFEQRALVESTKSLSFDPADFSAHRFLSDTYSFMRRHEIARVSELLQSQLLQPINMNPVQPKLAVTDLNLVASTRLADFSFGEYTQSFEKNRPQFIASGFGGSNGTYGDELVLSGIYDQLSYSFGQFHYQTDGFRFNNGLTHNIYNLFAQLALTPGLSVQTELRRQESEHGDIRLNFDLDTFSRRDRRERDQNSIRGGVHASLSPRSDLILSLVHTETRDRRLEFRENALDITSLSDDSGYRLEGQYLFRGDRFNVITGGGKYDIDSNFDLDLDFTPSIGVRCPNQPCRFMPSFSRERDNLYFYATGKLPKSMIWTVGLSYDAVTTGNFSINQLSPKVGLRWEIIDGLTLRAASIETVTPNLLAAQTIEPTQVAGFAQFFDDFEGTKARRDGIGIDARLHNKLYGGIEASQRIVDAAIFDPLSLTATTEDQEERLYRAYVYWIPHSNWTTRAEYRREESIRKPAFSNDNPTRLATLSVPVTVRYFSDIGIFGELGATYVSQQLRRQQTSSLAAGSDSFVLFDLAIGYRLPRRKGILSLEVKNILDENFEFQGDNFQTSQPTNPVYVPDRTLLARMTINF